MSFLDCRDLSQLTDVPETSTFTISGFSDFLQEDLRNSNLTVRVITKEHLTKT